MTPEMVEEFFNKIKSKHIIGRIGETSDTNAAIAYLADNNVASFLTGILMPIDGGYMLGN